MRLSLFAKDKKVLRFKKVHMVLHPRMPIGKILVDVYFVDGVGNRVEVKSVDLLKLIPTLDTQKAMQLPEYLLAEYNRFGVTFRREHGEFDIKAKSASLIERDKGKSIYRLALWNNCLSQTRFEMTLHAEDYSDFQDRYRSPLNLNQSRTLAHVWFFVNKDLYTALLRLKNRLLSFDPEIGYDDLIAAAKKVRIDLSGLRSLKALVPSKVLEVGHKSKRPLVSLDKEQYYKWQYKLAVNQDDFSSYDDILNVPVKLAKFQGRGFYQTKKPKVFDFGWLRQVDDVRIHTVDVPESDTYVQLSLSGKNSPYEIVMGNVDLADVDEQKFAGYLFGVNTYPKLRRHNPRPDTFQFDPDSTPDHLKPYLFLVNRKNGHWGDNHEIGVEKVYLAWESIDRDVLEIYVLSYERIVPVWMARVRLSDVMVDRIRRKRAMYAN